MIFWRRERDRRGEGEREEERRGDDSPTFLDFSATGSSSRMLLFTKS